MMVEGDGKGKERGTSGRRLPDTYVTREIQSIKQQVCPQSCWAMARWPCALEPPPRDRAVLTAVAHFIPLFHFNSNPYVVAKYRSMLKNAAMATLNEVAGCVLLGGRGGNTTIWVRLKCACIGSACRTVAVLRRFCFPSSQHSFKGSLPLTIEVIYNGCWRCFHPWHTKLCGHIHLEMVLASKPKLFSTSAHSSKWH